jgi:hypothetical protein
MIGYTRFFSRAEKSCNIVQLGNYYNCGIYTTLKIMQIEIYWSWICNWESDRDCEVVMFVQMWHCGQLSRITNNARLTFSLRMSRLSVYVSQFQKNWISNRDCGSCTNVYTCITNILLQRFYFFFFFWNWETRIAISFYIKYFCFNEIKIL